MISERKAEFIEHWNKGLSYAQMATVMPYSKNALYEYSRVLKANGEIQERKRGVKPTATEALLKEAYTFPLHILPTHSPYTFSLHIFPTHFLHAYIFLYI